MSKMIDITGQHFGRMTAIRPHSKHPRNGGYLWECRCECGVVKVASANSLKSGNTSSCGCLVREKGKANIQKARKGKDEKREAWHRARGTVYTVKVTVQCKPEHVDVIKRVADRLLYSKKKSEKKNGNC